MAFRLETKEMKLGFKEGKPTVYALRKESSSTITLDKLGEQVQKRGAATRGTVDSVLKDLVDTVIDWLEEGHAVQLGELGTFRPSVTCKASTRSEDLTASDVRRAKIIYTPGKPIRSMLNSVSMQAIGTPDAEIPEGEGGGSGESGGQGGSGSFE